MQEVADIVNIHDHVGIESFSRVKSMLYLVHTVKFKCLLVLSFINLESDASSPYTVVVLMTERMSMCVGNV